MINYFKNSISQSNHNIVEQFIRSAVAGLISSMIDMFIFSICLSSFSMYHLLAKCISFSVGLVINYNLNKYWVFNTNYSDDNNFWAFSLIGLVGLFMSSVFLVLFIDTGFLYDFFNTRNEKLIKLIANVITIVFVFLWTFVARKKFVFRDS